MSRICFLLLLFISTALESIAGDPLIQVINISADPFMGLAKVELGDSVLQDTLEFNEATAYLEVPEGSGQTLRFTAILDTTLILELNDLNLEADRLYQSILYGVEDDTDYTPNPDGQSLLLNATFVEVDTMGIEEGDVRTNFFHAVGDNVEVDVADLIFEFIVDDMAFGEYSSTSTDLPADNRALFFTSTDSVVVIASRSIDLGAITGNTITIFMSGFIIPINNENGPVLGLYGVDQAGNVIELNLVLSTPIDEILKDLSVYPNPATDFLNLDFYYDGTETLQIYFTDLAGSLYLEQRINIYPGSNYHRIELPDLANGLYLLNMVNIKDAESRSVPVLIVR